jgi:hypothetical protein
MPGLMIPHDGNLEPARLSPEGWTRALQEFTNRNCSRVVTLEVFDEREGDRVAERDRPFRGVDYDPRTDRAGGVWFLLTGPSDLYGAGSSRPRQRVAQRSRELVWRERTRPVKEIAPGAQ